MEIHSELSKRFALTIPSDSISTVTLAESLLSQVKLFIQKRPIIFTHFFLGFSLLHPPQPFKR